jgi:hypothetical protein
MKFDGWLVMRIASKAVKSWRLTILHSESSHRFAGIRPVLRIAGPGDVVLYLSKGAFFSLGEICSC